MEDFTEYFNQDQRYWSGSQAQFILIEDMPFQQAFYSHRKLIREHGLKEYGGTHLYQAFIRKLCPSPAEIRDQLARFGKACHSVHEPGPWASKTTGKRVRTKMYNAAPNKNITTHKVDTTVGSYIEATENIIMAVTRRGRKIV